MYSLMPPFVSVEGGMFVEEIRVEVRVCDGLITPIMDEIMHKCSIIVNNNYDYQNSLSILY